MKGVKDTIDVSGDAIVKIGSMTWKQVLTFLAVIAIVLCAAGVIATMNGERAAKDAVKAQLELQDKIHDYEMNLRMENSAALNNVVIQLLYATNADRVLLAEYHNGSSNVSGVPFLKWSVTFEAFKDEMGFGVANEYQQQQITLYPFITHIGENYLYRGYVETDLKEIDKSYAYKLMSHKIEYIIVSQIVNNKGAKCGMLILEYTDVSVIDEYNVKQRLHKASQECASLLTLSHHSCSTDLGI
jgi:cell division protein FtsL